MQKIVDPITLEVVYHRLDSIANEMETVLLKSAFSTVVKEGRDCSTAIFDAEGQTIAQGLSIPAHLGMLMSSVPQILNTFPVSEMQEGDVFIANDPFSGGSHKPDITMAVPVIYRDKVVALSCSMVHHQDIGAMTPGVPTSATSTYQEGLNLPPLKFYDAGMPVKVVHDIIKKNVRTPELVIGDLRAQVSACNVGKLRILELFKEYGNETVLGAMKQLLDSAELATRRELEQLPDGTYSFTGYIDNDGVDRDRIVEIQVAATIRGSDLTVDLSGTSPQVKGPINCNFSAVLCAVAYVIRAITDPAIPNNAGCFRPIKLKLPEKSLVNASSPAALGVRATPVSTIAITLMGALFQAAPDRLIACSNAVVTVIYFGGVDPSTGKEWGTVDLEMGGLGARPNKDGIDAISTEIVNIQAIPCEALEMNYPFRVLEWGIRDGSGGAGEFRGGLGVKKVIQLLSGEDVEATYRSNLFLTSPWGVLGGLAGASGSAFVVRKTGEKEEILSTRDFLISEGDQIHMLTGGGGGYGNPLKRRPELVLRDVLDRRVPLEAALEDYGVVIDRESMTVNLEETNKLRKEKARFRGPIPWTYDRGPQAGKDRFQVVGS